MAQVVPNLCVSRKVFLKYQVNWNTVCGAVQDLSLHNIWLAFNPVVVLNEHLSLLVGCYVSAKVIHVRSKGSLRLMINAGMFFGLKQEAHLQWTCDRSRVEFVRCQVRANETYSEAKLQFSDRNRW